MKNNFKKSIAFVLAVMMILVSAGFAFASEPPDQSNPGKEAAAYRWTGINSITGTFDILSGDMANPVVRGTTYAGQVDYVNVTVRLKRNSGSGWSSIKVWNQNITISLNKFTFNETYKVGKNYSYKYAATVKSYKNGVLLDTITFDSKIIQY